MQKCIIAILMLVGVIWTQPQDPTIRCGYNYADASTKCGVYCTSNSDCPNPQTCFASLPVAPCASPAPSTPTTPPDTIRCGYNYTDASTKCGVYCTLNSDCPNPQTCFAGLPVGSCVQPAPSTPTTPPDTIRCGYNYTDANSKCGVYCTLNSDCPNPQTCFGGLPVGPCTPPAPSTPTTPPDTIRCGYNYTDASTKCGVYCTLNSDCPNPQTCFGFLPVGPCAPPAPKATTPSTIRCGPNWSDADITCGAPCQIDADCPPTEHCYNSLDITPCHSVVPSPDPSPVHLPTVRCGPNWDDANALCGTPCLIDTQCTHLNQCFSGLVVTPCRSFGAMLLATGRCGTTMEEASEFCGNLCIDDGDCVPPGICYQKVNCVENSKNVLTGNLIGAIVAAVVVFLIVVVVVVVVLWKKWKAEQSLTDAPPLPPELSWSFQVASKNVNLKNGFYMKALVPDSSDWNSVTNLFYESLEGGDLKITEIFAVFSPSLVASFRIFKANMEKRLIHNQSLFVRSTWVVNDNNGLRQWVMDRYNNKVKLFSWNDHQSMPILPMVHGTSFTAAMSICSTGFANISCLDAGWYGKGIYFSSSATYCTPYFAATKMPALIIAYVLPGNPYPVIEHHNCESNLVGAALKTGYQSHYVCTTTQGLPVTQPSSNCYDELVIMQEAQVVPAFVLRIDTGNLLTIMKKFQREVTIPNGEQAQRFKDIYKISEEEV